MKKEILVLLLCLGVLAFFLYKTLAGGRWTTVGKQIPGASETSKAIRTQDIDKIELRRPDEIIVFSRRRDGSWMIASPIEAIPNPGKLDSILKLLTAKESPNTLCLPLGKDPTGHQAALKNFGMAKPVLGVVFSGGFGQRTLWLGENVPEGQYVYARWTHEMYIELVEAALRDILSAPLDDLRERRVLYDANRPIVGVQFRNKEQSLEILADGKAILRHGNLGATNAKEEEVVHRVNPATAREIFGFLDTITCKEYLDRLPQVLSRQTLMKIRLTRDQNRATGPKESPQQTWVLEKVSTVDGMKYLLQCASEEAGPKDLSDDLAGEPADSQTPDQEKPREEVLAGCAKYIVEGEGFSRFLGDLTGLLDKNWTDIQPENCTVLAFFRGSHALEFVRRDGVWVARQGKNGRIDQAKLTGFLQDLLSTKITRFIVCQEIPVQEGIEIRLGRDEKDATVITLKAQAGGWVAHRQGDPFLFTMEAKPSLDFATCADSQRWRDKSISDVRPEALHSITLIRPDGQVEFVKQDGKWRLFKPKPGEAQEEALASALGKLLPLTAEKFLSVQESTSSGKFKARLKMILKTPDKSQEIWLGRPDGGGIVGKLPGDETLFVLPKENVEPVLQDPIFFISLMEEDSNRNGKTDQWIHYRDGVRWWMQSDDDEDGQFDSKTYWRYGYGGSLLRMDVDTNNDDVIDQKTYFWKGVPYRQEDDTKGTGHVDLWTSFVKGVQARQRLDSDEDGKPDTVKKFIRDVNGEITGAQVFSGLNGQNRYVEKYEGQKVLRELLPKSSQ